MVNSFAVNLKCEDEYTEGIEHSVYLERPVSGHQMTLFWILRPQMRRVWLERLMPMMMKGGVVGTVSVWMIMPST